MTFPSDQPKLQPLTPVGGEGVGLDAGWVRMRFSVVDNPADWASTIVPSSETDTSATEVNSHSDQESADEIKRQVGQQLASIIDLIQSQVSLNAQASRAHLQAFKAEDLRNLDELVADPQKFDELIRRIVEEESARNGSGPEPAEGHTDPCSNSSAFGDDMKNGPLLGVGEAKTADADSHWELALDLPSWLARRAEMTVYEVDQGRLQLYILCDHGEPGEQGEELRTLCTDEQGNLYPGVSLSSFLEQLVASFPEQTVQWVLDGQNYLNSAYFSGGLDRLRLDPLGRCAALVELPMSELPGLMRSKFLSGQVQAAPADKGWSLIYADSQTLARLLEIINLPAIVAEKTFFCQNLSFVLPSEDNQAPSFDSLAQRLNRALGSPESGQVGAVLTFSWSATSKRGRISLPWESPAGDMIWSLPGRLPQDYQQIVSGDSLDQLIWIYGLNEQAARRLTNYVMDESSLEGLESALQALELPQELHKIIEGSVSLADFVGYQELSPDMNSFERLKESVRAYPNGRDSLSAFTRELIEHPWLITVDGFAQLGASGLLALWAAQRRIKGQSARSATFAATALGASGVAELVIARAYWRLHQNHLVPDDLVGGSELSVIDELQAQIPQEKSASCSQQVAKKSARSTLARLKNWGRKTAGEAKNRFRPYLSDRF